MYVCVGNERCGLCRSDHFNAYSYTPRPMPRWWHQTWSFFKREVVHFRRAMRTHILDLVLVAFGGACLGGSYLNCSWSRYPQMGTMSSLVLGMCVPLG
eukprot:m.114243 g.114243  ORF g.114243 m.114243 type:complete len:98 (+) comp17117_c0_seq7:3403-3696(+)